MSNLDEKRKGQRKDFKVAKKKTWGFLFFLALL